MYPESTTLITEIEATGVQLKSETFIAWSEAFNGRNKLLNVVQFRDTRSWYNRTPWVVCAPHGPAQLSTSVMATSSVAWEEGSARGGRG